jgi:hypothetical protein
MNRDTRLEIIIQLASIALDYPDLRIGQIVANAAGKDVYNISDEELLKRLAHHGE